MQGPLGVRVVEGRVWVHHLRLEPEAELEVCGGVGDFEVVDLGDEGGEAVREAVRVHLPVAEPGVVGETGVFVAEPPVVEDEQLDAQLGRLLRETVDGGFVVVEREALPAVQQHGARRGGELALHQVLAVQAVEAARHPAEPGHGVRHHALGGRERLAGRERPGELVRVEAEHGAGEALGPLLDFHGEGAGVDEGEAPGFALGLGSGGGYEPEEGVVEVRGVAGGAAEAG